MDLNSQDSLTTASAFRSVLMQILHRYRDDEAILDKFDFLKTRLSEGSSAADMTQLTELMKVFFVFRKSILVLDGIDECRDNEHLVELALWLGEHSSTKILFLSRPNVTSLIRTVAPKSRLMLSHMHTNPDIGMYLTNKVHVLLEDDYFPPGTAVHEIVAQLREAADGMFLWARLMINYLKSPALTPMKRLRNISNVIMFKGLETMYRHITDLIEQSDRTQRDLGVLALVWVLNSKGHLTLDQLHQALLLDEEEICGDDTEKFEDFEDAMCLFTGGLLELTADGHVRVIHLSAIDFFSIANGQGQTGLLPSPFIGNLTISRDCLRYLTRQRLLDAPAVEHRADSFTAYAVDSWLHHMRQPILDDLMLNISSNASDLRAWMQTMDALSKLLANPVATKHWLEFYYRLHRGFVASKWLNDAEDLKRWVSCFEISSQSIAIVDKLVSFIHDITKMELDWGEQIYQRPEILHDEVPAFRQSSFLPTSRMTRVTSMVPNPPDSGPSSNSKALAVISKSGIIPQIGNVTAVLSIWPSSSFQIAWKNGDPFKLQHCSGWVAHYQIWKHGEKSALVADIKIPVDEKEILTQLRQSFRMQWGEEQMSFPLTISETLRSIVVLRTLYSSDDNNRSCDWVHVRSALLPMDFAPTTIPLWTLARSTNSGFYTYTFTFSPDDRLLLFTDCVSGTYTGETHISHIAMFEVVPTSARTHVAGFAQITDLDLLLQQKVTFHTFLPMVFLAYNDGVKMWEYRRGKRKSKQLQEKTLTWQRDWNHELSMETPIPLPVERG